MATSDQFIDDRKNRILTLWNEGKTKKEIANIMCVPYETMKQYCCDLGLRRSISETEKLHRKCKLDNPETIEKIGELHKTLSWEAIAKQLGSSASTIGRLCQKYNIQTPDNYSQLQSERIKAAWTDDKKQAISQKIKTIFQDPEIRNDISVRSMAFWKSEEYQEKQRRQKDKWTDERRAVYSTKMLKVYANDPSIKEKISRASKLAWDRDEYRILMADFRAQMPKVSSLQTLLYSMLDDLGVKYYRERLDKEDDPECRIGPYNVDCVVPRTDRPSLIIECNGDYWHSEDRGRNTDRTKFSYISKHFPEKYEIKYLWEHEFKCKEKVIELLKYWLGMTKSEVVDFNFDEVGIKHCPAKEYKLLLSKYHYLSSANRGGEAYGAYLGDQLIAVCIFSGLPRQNIEIGEYGDDEVRELSRLCIHPRYQKKNFASWLVSRCIKLLDSKYKCIVSYCDKTFNHDGAVYKALNFKEDSIIRPDYWYADKDGWVMHKKTLYEHAVKMGITEKEYADKHEFVKVYGMEKVRYKYERQ